MSIEQEIRDAIERNKAIREEVGQMNCTLSELEHKCEQYMKAVDEAYQRGYEDGVKSVESWNDKEKKLRLDEAFDRGLTEAWELARAVWHDKCGERSKLGCVSIQGVFENYTAQEAIAKLKAYEDKQKEKDRIEVGDELTAYSGLKCIATVADYENDIFYVLFSDGSSGKRDVKTLKKTGRHFDIDKILEEMRND